ncbi:hypothetical protein [Amycolatopsis sp. CA-230715]|uniref:hypothetical protein n=1 Tax=Amycolatopsis sp. CA-230715 TaxID=2745196 RepID=UPI001C02F8C2|nr:hypothetical protein [Amycolatopsis sp. CA-230715]QWF85699.1 hypothetical protein HUW46_09179 [Amycolatopsis sp. CA-230715]
MPEFRSDTNVPVIYGATEHVGRSRLVPGVRVRRYTEDAPGGCLDVITPCCPRIARLRGDWRHGHHLVLCTKHALAYDVYLIDENDGGFGALFVVRDEQPVLARRRTGGWLAAQHPGDDRVSGPEDGARGWTGHE